MSGYSNQSKLVLMAILTLLLFAAISFVDADCKAWVYSSMSLPVENVEVTWMDGATNATLNTTTTDASGLATFVGDCVNVSARLRYPSSLYSAVLRNASVMSDVHINNVVTGRVQLINTLGQYLEGQDCSVVVYAANSTLLIRDYDTQCRPGEPYVDSTGNWVATSDCKFTDSLGWYYFQGRTDESLGFEYNHYYDLTFICNGKNQTVTFRLDVERPPADEEKIETWAIQYGGWIIAGGLCLLIVVGIIATVLFLLSRKGSSPSGM